MQRSSHCYQGSTQLRGQTKVNSKYQEKVWATMNDQFISLPNISWDRNVKCLEWYNYDNPKIIASDIWCNAQLTQDSSRATICKGTRLSNTHCNCKYRMVQVQAQLNRTSHVTRQPKLFRKVDNATKDTRGYAIIYNMTDRINHNKMQKVKLTCSTQCKYKCIYEVKPKQARAQRNGSFSLNQSVL